MKEKREFNPNPKTPLDDWDETVDPAIMSGDHWVQEENDPLEAMGFSESEECEVDEGTFYDPASRFMHPNINVSYGKDSFAEKRSRNKKSKE